MREYIIAHLEKLEIGSYNCKQLIIRSFYKLPREANSQYPRTYSVGFIMRIHLSVQKARALNIELKEAASYKNLIRPRETSWIKQQDSYNAL